jgi:hypothetical protein
MKSIIEDLAHTEISTTVWKKGSRREASLKLLIKNYQEAVVLWNIGNNTI